MDAKPLLLAHILVLGFWVITSCAFTTGLEETPARSETTWKWFRASSTGSRWWITNGEARVTVEGEAIRAELRDAEDPSFVRVSLRGRISNRDVEVRATVHGTDMLEFDLDGRLRRLCWESEGGREFLVLTNGMAVIALTRDLEVGKPCEPAA